MRAHPPPLPRPPPSFSIPSDAKEVSLPSASADADLRIYRFLRDRFSFPIAIIYKERGKEKEKTINAII
jgi:hypothetical protein